MSFLLFLIFSTYSFYSGRKDGVLWSGKKDKAFKSDEHKTIFMPERLGVGLSIVLPPVLMYFELIDLTGVLAAVAAFVLSFMFFHNGSYYIAREEIDGAYNSWFAYSKDYKSPWNFRPIVRTISGICGVIILFIYEIFIKPR